MKLTNPRFCFIHRVWDFFLFQRAIKSVKRQYKKSIDKQSSLLIYKD